MTAQTRQWTHKLTILSASVFIAFTSLTTSFFTASSFVSRVCQHAQAGSYSTCFYMYTHTDHTMAYIQQRHTATASLAESTTSEDRRAASTDQHSSCDNAHTVFTRNIPLTGSRFSVAVDQRSYSMLGPVSAWVGDRLWMGKPPYYKTRYPGLLSLSPALCGQAGISTRRKLGSKQAQCVIHQPISVVSQCGTGVWLYHTMASGDQHRLTVSGSASDVR